jgi:hypothetical protein
MAPLAKFGTPHSMIGREVSHYQADVCAVSSTFVRSEPKKQSHSPTPSRDRKRTCLNETFFGFGIEKQHGRKIVQPSLPQRNGAALE